jgi:single-stranded-DNA-specific exonuclease
MKYRWNMAEPQPDLCAGLGAALGISPLFAQCLVNRGHADADALSRFLQPRLKNLADPFLLPNMNAAVERLLDARQRGELVVIFGDYDVDGVTTTALLLETLGALGWKLAHYLPHRMDEGYGFSHDAVETCVAQFAPKLLLAVDCGSTAFDTISALKGRGIDVIVLDHHQLSPEPPPAVALVNPQVGSEFQELCSVGLAFKLVHALLKRMRDKGLVTGPEPDLRDQLDLVALGTIADLAPLRGENRIFASAGLERLCNTHRSGIIALKSVSRCPAVMTSYEAAFQLSPRLNAAGRMQDAEDALSLLLAREPGEADRLARRLDDRNRERQDIERKICKQVLESVRGRFNAETDYVIVEGADNWHIGVVGIVAARVLQEFYRPTIILGGDGGLWRGSGRSIEGFDLAAALRECGELLSRHGGHAMAAGLTLSAANVVPLRERLNNLARQALTGGALQPSLKLDAPVQLQDLTIERVTELAQLEPSGQGNAPIRLVVGGLRHQAPPLLMGRENQHVKFRVTDGARMLEAVWWNAGKAIWPAETFDLAVTAGINEFRGKRSVQLRVLDWRPCV